MLVQITCRMLTELSLRERAAKIVDKKYREEGYIRGDTVAPSKIAAYISLDEADVFGAFINEQLYGTLSLVFDDKRGLPMDSIYKDEIDVFRTKKYKLGEVVQFAVDKVILEEQLSPYEVSVSSLPLFGCLLSYAKKNDFDFLCITVNPKHVSFYTLIGFEKIGDIKYYASVDAPAVAMTLAVKGVHGEWFNKNSVTKMIKTFFERHQTDNA